MAPSVFFLAAAFVFAFGLISARFQRTVVSPPMIFVGFGMIIGPHALNLLDLNVNDELVHTVNVALTRPSISCEPHEIWLTRHQASARACRSSSL